MLHIKRSNHLFMSLKNKKKKHCANKYKSKWIFNKKKKINNCAKLIEIFAYRK